jgi:hypothetical protein
VGRLSRQCGILNISQPYRPSRPVTGIAFLFLRVFRYPLPIIHRPLHTDLLSTGAGTIGQIVACLPSALSFTPSQQTKKKTKTTTFGGSATSSFPGKICLPLVKPLPHYCYFVCTFLTIITRWSESASELYRPSDCRLSAKSVPSFADRGCHVVNATDSYCRILGFLDRSRYYFFQVAPQLYSRGCMNPVPDPVFLRKSGIAGNRNRASGSVANNSKN